MEKARVIPRLGIPRLRRGVHPILIPSFSLKEKGVVDKDNPIRFLASVKGRNVAE